MVKRQVNKQTRRFIDTETPEVQKKYQPGELTTNWQGRVFVLDPEKSRVAKEMGFEYVGEYAIKVR